MSSMNESSGTPEQNITELEQHRLEKLNDLKQKEYDLYPPRFERSHSAREALEQFFQEEDIADGMSLSVAGRVVASRPMGKAAFFHLEDISGRIQIYGNDKTLSEKEHYLLKNIDLGDIVGIEGEPFRTKKGEPSVRAKKYVLISKNLSVLPVVKEKDGVKYDAFADVEQRYRKRYVDLAVNPDVREDFILRSKIIKEIRSFLHSRDFLEVETPMMQAVASGAAARPFVTHHNTLDMQLYLRIAPELYLKRLLVGGFEKVFELNRNFRNEGISTKHNPEFTMIEIYQAYADYETMMQLTEDIFTTVADKVLGSREIEYGDVTISLNTPWPRKPYLEIIKEKTGLDFSVFLEQEQPSSGEAVKMAQSIGIKIDPATEFWDVVDEIFSQKVEPELIQPVFITEFPRAISPLSKNIPGNPHLVERFEPYITGREMGNAFSELNDPQEQQKRFEEQLKLKEAGAEETMQMDEDFIEALKTGMPNAGGLGIGIDRMVMLFANKQSIKDVILFPLLRKKD